MLLHVQYKDFSYQYVDARSFGKLLAEKPPRRFYSPSEERSANAYCKPVRGLSSQNYNQQGELIKNTSIAQSTFEIYI
jgi:hypothetical protein